ncbi:hypothetical protein [Enterococcus pallens]|uniref:Uncharacterized protein n=1 Tax=Enterococcus pallens ATCC BAA-351 TaxID=1158607 RepID=R2SYI0_9ENTE|nr:hypothetical protein [Enterococcus pallens]EOH93049.1 hypothetical protein UAU_02691 [Enterococcus pallens ATCC BAA-351]EOU24835.1 hypothetical protein I588_00822 [Enterococcus pallens ATCC BAA-351]
MSTTEEKGRNSIKLQSVKAFLKGQFQLMYSIIKERRSEKAKFHPQLCIPILLKAEVLRA